MPYYLCRWFCPLVVLLFMAGCDKTVIVDRVLSGPCAQMAGDWISDRGSALSIRSQPDSAATFEVWVWDKASGAREHHTGRFVLTGEGESACLVRLEWLRPHSEALEQGPRTSSLCGQWHQAVYLLEDERLSVFCDRWRRY